MSMMENVRKFICGCPHLREGKLNVDYLGAEPTEYTVRRVAADEVLKQYADGGKLKKLVFTFHSREWMGRTVADQLQLAEFYEQFGDWIAEKNDMGELPELGERKIAQSIRVTKAGALQDQAGDSAKYQMECTLIYFEGGEGING